MPDTLAAMRTSHVMLTGNPHFCRRCGQKWPCDASVAVAHLDALTQRHREYEELLVQRAEKRIDALTAAHEQCTETCCCRLAILGGEQPIKFIEMPLGITQRPEEPNDA